MTSSAKNRRRGLLLVVLFATASFFWLVTAVGDAASTAQANDQAAKDANDQQEGDPGDAPEADPGPDDDISDGNADQSEPRGNDQKAKNAGPPELQAPDANERDNGCGESQLSRDNGEVPFNIGPFFTGGDDVPDCRESLPQPSATLGACGIDTVSMPYGFETAVRGAEGELVGAALQTCYDLVGRSLNNCPSMTQWVVGTVAAPANPVFAGVMKIMAPGGNIIEFQNLGSTTLNGDPNTLQFWGVMQDITAVGTQMEIEIYGQVIGTFPLEPDNCDGSAPRGNDQRAADVALYEVETGNPCDGVCIGVVNWDCAGNITVDIDAPVVSQPTIVVTFTPDAGGATMLPVTPTFDSGSSSWSANPTFGPNQIAPGKWKVSTSFAFPEIPELVWTTSLTNLRTDCEAMHSLACPTLTSQHNLDEYDSTYQFPYVESVFLEITPKPGDPPTPLEPIEYFYDYDSGDESASYSLPSLDGTGWFSADTFDGYDDQGEFTSLVLRDGFAVASGAVTESNRWYDAAEQYACVAGGFECSAGQAYFSASIGSTIITSVDESGAGVVIADAAPPGTIIAGPSASDPFSGSGDLAFDPFPSSGEATYWIAVQDSTGYSNRAQFVFLDPETGRPQSAQSMTGYADDCSLQVGIYCEAGAVIVSVFGDAPANEIYVDWAGSEGTSFSVDDFSEPLPSDTATTNYTFTLSTDNPDVHLAWTFFDGEGYSELSGAEIDVPGLDCLIDLAITCGSGMPRVTVVPDDWSSFMWVTTDTRFPFYFGEIPASPTPRESTDDQFQIISLGDEVKTETYDVPASRLVSFEPAIFEVAGSAFFFEGEIVESIENVSLPSCTGTASISCQSYGEEPEMGVASIFVMFNGTPPEGTEITVTSSGADADTGIIEIADELFMVSNQDPGKSFAYSLEASMGVVITPSTLSGVNCIVDLIGPDCSASVVKVTADRPDPSNLPDLGFSSPDSLDVFDLLDGVQINSEFFYPFDDDVDHFPTGDQARFSLSSYANGLILRSGEMTGSVLTLDTDLQCVFTASMGCANGDVLVDATDALNTPAGGATVEAVGGGTVTPGAVAGTFIVPENTDIMISAAGTTDVWVQDEFAESATESITLSGIGCTVTVTWSVLCDAGTPYGVATDVTGPTEDGHTYNVSPEMAEAPASSEVAGADLFTVSVSTSAGAMTPAALGFAVVFSPETITTPSCEVFASAVCVGGVITITLQVDGVDPSQVLVNGDPVALTGASTEIIGIGATQVVEFFVGAADDPTTFTLTPCTVELSVEVECVDAETGRVVVTQTGGTGTIDQTSVTVNGSTERPFVVDAGSGAVTIQVVSDNTIAANISIPEASAPAEGECSDATTSDIFVFWSTGCAAGLPDTAVVILQITGSPLGVPTVNGTSPVDFTPEGNGIYQVPDNSPVSIIVVGGSKAVAIIQSGAVAPEGPGRTPDCASADIVPDEPEPEPEAVPIPEPEPEEEPDEEEPDEEEPDEEPAPGPAPESRQPAETEPEPDEEEPETDEEEEPEEDEEEPAPAPVDDEVLDIVEPSAPVEIGGSVDRNGGSTIALPVECDLDPDSVDVISVPGTFELREIGPTTTADGSQAILFRVEAPNLLPGEYTTTLTCGSVSVTVSSVVHSATEGQRGERTIAATVTALSALGLALGGSSRLWNRVNELL